MLDELINVTEDYYQENDGDSDFDPDQFIFDKKA